MKPELILLSGVIGFFAGLTGGALGIGGGVVLVPLFLMVLGLNMKAAVGTSLACLVAYSAVGFISQARYGNVRWAVFGKLVPLGLVGSYLGGELTTRLPVSDLKRAFGAIMLLVGVKLAFFPNWPRVGEARAAHGRAWLQLLLIGFVAGLVGGTLGIGGGVLLVPIFLMVVGMNMREAVGTSLACLVAYSPVAMVRRVVEHDVDWPVFLMVMPLGLVGSWLGVRLANRLPAVLLKRTFGVLMMLLAVKFGLFPDWPKQAPPPAQQAPAVEPPARQAPAGEEEGP